MDNYGSDSREDWENSRDDWGRTRRGENRRNADERTQPNFYNERTSNYQRSQEPRRGRRWRLILFGIFGVVVIVAGTLFAVDRLIQTPPAPAPFQCTAHFPNPVKLTLYYDLETQDWMKDVIGNFNKKCEGKIVVELHGDISGQTMQEILAGQIKPDIWSPASSLWLQLLNEQWQTSHSGSKIFTTNATDTPSLVKSPVVIAMWQPMAAALGWPNNPIYWTNIAQLSENPQGWAAYGHPEWGNFKFGHTNPNFSNTGLAAVLAENYAAVHKAAGLTTDDVDNQKTQGFVAGVESSVIHYGNDTDAFANEMFSKGPSYLSAVVMNESMVAEANAGKQYTHLKYPVVAIYPKDGTFISDHPFAIPQAGWLTPDQKTAALLLRDFLLNPIQQQAAMAYYLRPGTNLSPNTPGSPLKQAHGIDLSSPFDFGPPPPDVIGKTKTNFSNERNRVDVMVILDRSLSMKDSYNGASKLEKAKDGLIKFVSLFSKDDYLGITVFSDQEEVMTPVSQLGPKRSDVYNIINSIVANGNTRLFDTIGDQVANLQGFDIKKIKAVVVLTDGINDVGQLTTAGELDKKITPGGDNEGEGVKVYTIAYGNPSEVDSQDLKDIATSTGGEEYSGTPQSICQVYYDITTVISSNGTSSC